MKKTVIRNLFSLDQHLEMYFEIIESNLDFPPKVCRRYMRLLKREVTTYVRHHPNAVMSDICKMFGDPYDQNAAVLKMIENGYARETRTRNTLFAISTIALIVLLVIAVCFCVHYFTFNDEYIYISDARMIGVVFL